MKVCENVDKLRLIAKDRNGGDFLEKKGSRYRVVHCSVKYNSYEVTKSLNRNQMRSYIKTVYQGKSLGKILK